MLKRLNRTAMAGIAAATLLAPGAAYAATAKANPKVDEVILFEKVTTMPVNLASSILDAEVYSMDEKKLGSVSDIIFDDSNQIIALKVGVGGFLGIDKTYIAIPMNDVTFSYVDSKLKIMTDLAEQDIRDAATTG
jgi:sporulation protein YlmC with PRC-barrel domain